MSIAKMKDKEWRALLSSLRVDLTGDFRKDVAEKDSAAFGALTQKTSSKLTKALGWIEGSSEDPAPQIERMFETKNLLSDIMVYLINDEPLKHLEVHQKKIDVYLDVLQSC